MTNQEGKIGKDQSKLNPLQAHVESMESGINEQESAESASLAEKEASDEAFERMRQMAGIKTEVHASQISEAGWFNVDMSKLGKSGKLYPADLQLIYRAARSGEIRHWSNLEDSANIVEAGQHITDIIAVCVRCVSKSGNNVYTFKDIYEHDKWKLLMLIHDVTFPENAEITNPLKLQITSGVCKHKFTMNMTADNVHFVEPDEMMDKYINPEIGAYEVQTRSYGTFVCKPPTIGIAMQFTEYIKTLDRETVLNAKSTLYTAEWLVLEWRGLNNDKIIKVCQEFNSIEPLKELPLKLDILDKCKIAPAETFKFICPKCAMEGEAPFRFPNGIKQIFRPISNIEQELL